MHSESNLVVRVASVAIAGAHTAAAVQPPSILESIDMANAFELLSSAHHQVLQLLSVGIHFQCLSQAARHFKHLSPRQKRLTTASRNDMLRELVAALGIEPSAAEDLYLSPEHPFHGQGGLYLASPEGGMQKLTSVSERSVASQVYPIAELASQTGYSGSWLSSGGVSQRSIGGQEAIQTRPRRLERRVVRRRWDCYVSSSTTPKATEGDVFLGDAIPMAISAAVTDDDNQ
eukprot:592388-Amphidinium_carterae.1